MYISVIQATLIDFFFHWNEMPRLVGKEVDPAILMQHGGCHKAFIQ